MEINDKNIGIIDEILNCCRTCLTKEGVFHSIYNDNVVNILKECTSIQIELNSENNLITSLICDKCRTILIDFQNFKQVSLEADQYLKQTVQHLQNNFDENSNNDYQQQPNHKSIKKKFDSEVITQQISNLQANLEKLVQTESADGVNADEDNTNNDNDLNMEKFLYQSEQWFDSKNFNKTLSKKLSNEVILEDILEEEKPNILELDLKPKLLDDNNKRHKCPECDLKFYQPEILIKHVKLCHKQFEFFTCQNCQLEFWEQKHLDEHVCQQQHDLHDENIDDNLSKVCQLCGKQFSRQFFLERHINNAHSLQRMKERHEAELRRKIKQKDHLNKAVCNICGKQFIKYNLESHIKKHEKTLLYTCRFCGIKFDNLNTLCAHSKREHVKERKMEVKPVGCSICGKLFRTSSLLTSHRQSYHNEYRPYMCSVCSKCFKKEWHLTKHMRAHTDERPYPCDFCGKPFRDKSTLKSHRFLHTGEKPYTCMVCNKSFTKAYTLQIHLRAKHKINKFKIERSI